MMMRRRPILVAGAVALFVAPSTSLAQAPTSGQPRRIGFLSADPDRFRDAAESQRPLAIAMRKLGWDVGNTLVIERAFADGKIERLAGLAGELVRKGVEVILVDGQAATLAAARATRSIPIVFYGVGWPVEQGFIDSYS